MKTMAHVLTLLIVMDRWQPCRYTESDPGWWFVTLGKHRDAPPVDLNLQLPERHPPLMEP